MALETWSRVVGAVVTPSSHPAFTTPSRPLTVPPTTPTTPPTSPPSRPAWAGGAAAVAAVVKEATATARAPNRRAKRDVPVLRIVVMTPRCVYQEQRQLRE